MADSKTLITIALGLVVAVYLLDVYFCRKKHPNEPPYLRPIIPLIGHVVGLFRYGGKYYGTISHGQPEIITLPVFNFRVYVVNSRHMMPVIQKNARTVSFKPFSKVAAERFCRASPYFVSLHEDPHSFLNDQFRETRNALTPGKGLDHQNLGTGKSIERFILKLESDASRSKVKDLPLFEWTQHVISVATTDGVFGEKNPFRDPEVEASHWKWQSGAGKLMTGIPEIFLRNELDSLSKIYDAYEKYCLSDHSDAADVVVTREALCDRNEVSLRDKAGNLIGFNIALLGNTVPTAFWALYDIISRPELLDAIRQEMQRVITRTSSTGRETFEIDVVGLRTTCPLLLSSYQETQRVRNVHASIRKILADTTIESLTTRKKYFLAKGNYLQMPCASAHFDEKIWGANPDKFNPYRFIKDNVTIPRDKIPESYAFMAWGIAPHVCPARQFASTEVMLFVAMMVMRFDIEDSQKGWKMPKEAVGEFSTVPPPEKEVYVDVKRREGWQGEWKLKMGDSTQKVPLASG